MKRFALLILILCVFAACKKKKEVPSYKILILGNSVTYSRADTTFKWTGNWGMAATRADKDYVHLFIAELKKINSNNDVRIRNITQFEVEFDTYNVAENLKDELAYNPDLLILRIGENVTRTQDGEMFDQKYQGLINSFKAKNSSIKILAAGSVWPYREFANNVMKKHSQFISLDFLQYDTSNYAYGQFENHDVQTHPSDKGMAAIATYLFETVKPILYPNNN